MRQPTAQRAGFTLLELMISVAIVGVLAAIAIPSFQKVQLRTKIGEGRTNLSAIRTAEEAFYGEFGTFVGAAATPATPPGPNKVSWPAGSDFERIGWAPDGTVQFQYSVVVPPGAAQVFTAEAISDLDGDTVQSAFGYVRQHPSGGAAIAGAVCPATGAYNPASGMYDRLDVVGPCNPESGVSAF